MQSYILILWLYVSGGPPPVPVEFNSKRSCEAAGAQIEERFAAHVPRNGVHGVVWACVAKD